MMYCINTGVRWLAVSFIISLLTLAVTPVVARTSKSSVGRPNKDSSLIPNEMYNLKTSFFTVYTLDNTLSSSISPNVSAKCFNDSVQYMDYIKEILFALLAPQNVPLPPIPQWALTMLDATGKVPTGLFQGNLNWLGSFSECLAIRVNTSNDQESFRGQYCTLTFENSSSSTQNTNEVKLNTQSSVSVLQFVSIGICWPSTCQDDEIALMLQYFANFSDLQPILEMCQIDAPKTFDSVTIAVIAIYSLFGVLMLTGTIQEIIFLWKKSHNHELEDDIENDQSQGHGYIYRFFLSFSVYKNGKKLLNTSQQQGQNLTCVHGMRFISMLWVILGHTYDYLVYLPLKDPVDITSILKRWTFEVVLSGTFAVDTFLLLSGFLITYLCLKEMKKNGRLNFIYLFLHRYWRLTPALAMVVAFVAGPYYLMGSGPEWPGMKFGQDTCRNYWWRTLLYITNLYDTQNMCIEVSWYLAIDMQFLIVAAVIIIALYRIPILGLSMMVVCFLITTLTPTLYIYFHDIPGYSNTQVLLNPSAPDSAEYSSMVYIKPYCRMGPYLVGMSLAYFLYKKDSNIKIPKIVLFVGWIFATALGLALVYGKYGYYAKGKTMSDALNSLYGGFASTAWGVVVAWVLLVCVTGYGGYVNTILSWKAFVPLGRLSYFAYLIHLYVMLLLFASQEIVYYVDYYLTVLLYCGIVVITLLVSVVATLAFEVPMIELEKLILRRDHKKQPLISNNNLKSDNATDKKSDQLSTISTNSGENREHFLKTTETDSTGCYQNAGFNSNEDDDLKTLTKTSLE